MFLSNLEKENIESHYSSIIYAQFPTVDLKANNSRVTFAQTLTIILYVRCYIIAKKDSRIYCIVPLIRINCKLTLGFNSAILFLFSFQCRYTL